MLRILPLMLMLTFLLSACENTEKVSATDGGNTIKVVDTARISRESKPGKDGMEFIGKLQAEIQEEVTALQAKLQADPENAEIQQEIQMYYGLVQQRMQAEVQNATSIMNDLVLRILDEYRTKNNLSVILNSENALSYDKSLDITTEIIEILNKQSVEYKSVFSGATEGDGAKEKVAPETQTENKTSEGDAPEEKDATSDKNKVEEKAADNSEAKETPKANEAEKAEETKQNEENATPPAEEGDKQE